MKRNLLISWIFILFGYLSVMAQKNETALPNVELFLGAELHYRDIYYNRMYDVLMNLTPGIKWNFGNQWQLAGQAIVPVYNDYGERYKKIRLNMAVLSKEWDWNKKQFLKVSGGLFGQKRYGVDIKWMYPVNHWMAMDAQVGLTGFCSMAADWECSRMERMTGQAGINLYARKINGLPYAVKMYVTDPEENEREGHFNRNRLQWGANLMTPDFCIKEKGTGK